jgi:hypothetical protein
MEKTEFTPDFLIIPKEVMHLPPADRFIMGAVYFMSRLSLGKCIASNVELGRICGVKAHSVTAALDRLEGEGLIKRTFKDINKRHREEIICLIGYGKLESSGLLKSSPLLKPLESSVEGHISNTISNNNITSEDEPRTQDSNKIRDWNSFLESSLKQARDGYSFTNKKGNLVSMPPNHSRYFALYFLKRKGLKFNSIDAVDSALRRHYKAGKELSNFISDPKKLSEAFDKAEHLEYNGQKVDWSLETVLKLITK